jgi:adenylate cyclase
MFTDLVGYTALGQTNESLSLGLVDEQRRLLRPIFRRHNGREVKTIGDAFLVEFPSALEAVRCAYDVQRAIREFNIAVTNEKRIRLRTGIHLGDVMESHGDILGDAVNIASRIEPLASEGGICLTQQVYDQISNKFELKLESLGKKALKNLSVPIEVYRVVLPWENEAGEEPAMEKHRVAVLPFANISPDPTDEYFADGMTEEMISTLSRIGGLKVISRTSAMRFKGSAKSIGEIARELNVGSILEGSVRKVSDNLRISVQLIDTRNDEHLWSQDYDRKLENALTIQSEIARRVAEALEVRILTVDIQQLQEKAIGNTEAYTLYIKGRYFWNKGTLEDFSKALDLFEKAVERDPTFAPSYSGVADTYLVMGRFGHVSPKFSYPKAIEYAQKAISLDARLPEPHVALAAIRQEYEWKWEEAEQEFINAIRLNPSYSTGHAWYALYLGHVGRIEQAVGEAKRAQELDPLSTRSHIAVSEEYLFAHEYDKAIVAAERAIEVSPNFGGAYGYRGYAEVEKGMYDEAIADFRKADQLQGGRGSMGRQGHVYGLLGKIGEATRILDDLMNETGQPAPRSPFLPPPPDTSLDIGLVYLGLADNERSIDWLEKAADARTAEVIHFKSEPIYERLRRESRFKTLMTKIGIGK